MVNPDHYRAQRPEDFAGGTEAQVRCEGHLDTETSSDRRLRGETLSGAAWIFRVSPKLSHLSESAAVELPPVPAGGKGAQDS